MLDPSSFEGRLRRPPQDDDARPGHKALISVGNQALTADPALSINLGQMLLSLTRAGTKKSAGGDTRCSLKFPRPA
jgi:hypothetical protein